VIARCNSARPGRDRRRCLAERARTSRGRRPTWQCVRDRWAGQVLHAGGGAPIAIIETTIGDDAASARWPTASRPSTECCEANLRPVKRTHKSGTWCPLRAWRLLPPLSGPHKIIRVGLNYASHAAEADVDVPERPLLFGKVWHTVIGPGAEIRMPYEDCHLDYGGAGGCHRLSGSAAARRPGARVRGGYTCFNDVSDRAAQLGDGRWYRGRNFPAFALLGPLIVTMGRAGGPRDLQISCV
jgi:2-keto-4-pentenoate hydratase/2-oxohepta-3-ene-1,7-dioic acid hydratase in catechol pathway